MCNTNIWWNENILNQFVFCSGSLIGRKSKNRKLKEKPHVQSQRDEDSGAFTSDYKYKRESRPMQETSEPAWVYPQSSCPPRDPAPLPSSADNTYRFCHETRGFAVLIINSKFDDQAKRENAVWDEYYMYKMFKELNFDVYILRNLASKELLEKMKGTHVSISCPFIINTRLLNCNIMLIKWR